MLEAGLVIRVARACHQVNKAYCESLGDTSQVNWEDAPEWQRKSCIDGVEFNVRNPEATPESAHQNWMSEKLKNGWVRGDVKDIEKKTHPCIVPYEMLPPEQQLKDKLFQAVVRSF